MGDLGGASNILDSTENLIRRSKVQPRAIGKLRLSSKSSATGSKLADLYQEGSLKALFPRSIENHLSSVFVNTAGGITGGDAFALDLTAQSDSRISISSQAAERAYRAPKGETGTIDLTATIFEGARIDWLPQETILFDAANLKRRINVSLARDAEFFCVEPLVFGRAAMGETVTSLNLSDQWRIHRNGELIFADALRITGNAREILNQNAATNGQTAIANILFISPKAETFLNQLRALMPDTGGASLIRDGVLSARVTAVNSFELRKTLIPVIEALSQAPLPKVWTL